jgi:hypothetical protein
VALKAEAIRRVVTSRFRRPTTAISRLFLLSRSSRWGSAPNPAPLRAVSKTRRARPRVRARGAPVSAVPRGLEDSTRVHASKARLARLFVGVSEVGEGGVEVNVAEAVAYVLFVHGTLDARRTERRCERA